MAQLMKRPRRLAAPQEFGRSPMLEQLHQPLYSAVSFDNAALPRQVQFFSYQQGQTVAGAGGGAIASTAYHTNLQTSGFLAAPKVFTCYGVRLKIGMLDNTAGAPALINAALTAAVPTADANFEDTLAISYTGIFNFTVGPKKYITCPAYCVPSNTGVGGLVSASIDDGTAATSRTIRRSAPHVAGKAFSLRTYPVIIGSQQSFSAELVFPWATNITLGADRYVWCVLDGILSREVQ